MVWGLLFFVGYSILWADNLLCFIIFLLVFHFHSIQGPLHWEVYKAKRSFIELLPDDTQYAPHSTTRQSFDAKPFNSHTKRIFYGQFGMLQIYIIYVYKRILMVWTLREYHNFSSVKHQFVTIQSKCVSPFKWLYYGKHNTQKKDWLEHKIQCSQWSLLHIRGNSSVYE